MTANGSKLFRVNDNNDHNLFSVFSQQFTARASRELLQTADGTSLSYADVERLSARIASALSGLGVVPGDRVSVQVEKSPACLGLYLACLRAGFVFHPLNTGYTNDELDYFLTNAEPRVVVCDPSAEAAIEALARKAGVKNILTLDGEGKGSLTERARDASSDFGIVRRSRDDLAALLYSSGTTGVPKGIMLSHFNLTSNTRTLVSSWGFTEQDRLLHALPIFHVHGLFVAIGCVLASGASMRWLNRYDVTDVIRFLPECTVMMGVPTYYTRLLADASFTRESTRNVRLFVSGSAPLRAETFVEFEERTGHRILERYGMTETNMNTSNPLDGERRPGTVGPPLPGVEIRVCDDDDRILGVNEPGHLLVRGPNVFVGYWKLPEKTAEDFTGDGYFRTGDQAEIDADGYVSIVGRAKDMVITGGLNVYPKELETLIDDFPGVRESAVIGVPHPDFGEGVVAVVVRTPDARIDEQTLIDSCKERVAGFKVPKRVVFVDELPRNTMAKVQKNVLRERCQALFSKDDKAAMET
jgi:malonyl-CoA/methylmalonyl-CoA synthetase